jgi:hypothetical protein
MQPRLQYCFQNKKTKLKQHHYLTQVFQGVDHIDIFKFSANVCLNFVGPNLKV